MQRGFAGLLILAGVFLIVIVAVVGFYLGRTISLKPYQVISLSATASPSPQALVIINYRQPLPSPTLDEIADWKIYTNDMCACTIRYPETWFLTTSEVYDNSDVDRNAPIQSIRLTRYPVSGVGDDLMKLGYEVTISVQRTATTPNEIWLKSLKDGSNLDKDFEQISLDRVAGIKFNSMSVQGPGIKAVLSHNNILIVVHLGYFVAELAEGRQKYPEAEKLLNRILSTFKFSEPRTEPGHGVP